MKHRRHLAALALSLAGCSAFAAPAWITLSDDALKILQRMSPQAQVLASTEVSVTVPEAARSSALRTRAETVHAVEVDDLWLEMLSLMAHRELQRCGGYVFHASEAEARAALHRLQAGQEPQAVGPVPDYAIVQFKRVIDNIGQLQASNILSTIDSLAAYQNRRHDSSHGALASAWLFNSWAALKPASRTDVTVTQVSHTNTPQKSVSFEITGSGRPDEVVVVGGHLDSIASGAIETVRAPGADDNASGIAGITEIIRVLMETKYRPKRTLRFIGYAAEEVGLRGSAQVAQSYVSSAQGVVGVLQLDMTAFKSPLDSLDIWLYTDYTNAAQNQFLANLAATYLPQVSVGYSACGYGCSDHASWHNRGFRASFPHEASNANYNKAIHTINDTTATFGNTASHALKFTQLALAYAVELAGRGVLIGYPPPPPPTPDLAARKAR
jgi:bacterial leucyl aminopeptidase